MVLQLSLFDGLRDLLVKECLGFSPYPRGLPVGKLEQGWEKVRAELL